MKIRRWKSALFAACAAVCAATSAQAQVVISQIYGGAGATGATYTNDYIVLFNRAPVAVNVSSWSVQYAAATGTSWSRINLTGSIPASGYYLVQCASGTGTSPLPITPDASGTAISMSATVGKVALVANQTTIGAVNYVPPGVGGVVDFVAYGATAAAVYGFEGSGAATVNPSTTLAVWRLVDGCTDTQNNATDFVASAPLPRNTASATNPCTGIDPRGACCLVNGTCIYASASECATASGTYKGDYIPCAVGTYTVTNNSAALIDISATGTNITGTGGDTFINPALSAAPLALPFPINYFGQTYTGYRVDSNGWMTLASNFATATGANTAFPATGTPVATLSAYWDDLTTISTSTGRIYSQTNGVAPNRQFIVQWDKMRWWSTTANCSNENTFQIIFDEATQGIEFRYGNIVAQGALYGPCVGTVPTAVSFNAGIEDLAGSNGVNIDPASLGTGGASAARQFTPTGQCPVTGACCRAGSCFTASALSCIVGGGVYSGDGVACGPTTCISGACCLQNSTCELQTPGQCAGNNGIYQGDSTTCGMTPCPDLGACCIGVACTVTFGPANGQCTGGTWTVGGSCSTNLCAGSCCNPITNACSLVTDAAACGMGNTFSGAGSTCTSNPCPAPVNDACNGAIVIPTSSLGTAILGGNGSATNDAGLPTCVTSSFNLGVWYVFTPTDNHRYQVSTCSTLTTYNTRLYVYSSLDSCATLTCVSSNTVASPACADRADAATVAWCTTAGTAYYILVANDTTGTGAFGLTVSDLGDVCPPNDTCATATPIMVGSSTLGNNAFATTDANPLGGSTACNTLTSYTQAVWYTFTETEATPRRLRANLCSTVTAFDAQMYVHSGSACAGFACVGASATSSFGCDDQQPARNPGNDVMTDTPNMVWCTVPGTTYYILVTTQSGSGGAFQLNFTDTGIPGCDGTTPPTNDTCATARVISTMPYSELTFPATATDDDDITCNDNINPIASKGIWYTFTTGADAGRLSYRRLPTSTTNSNGDMVITGYAASSCPPGMTEAFCTTVENGSVVATLAANTQYYFLISYFNTALASWASSNQKLTFTPITGACCTGTSCAVTTQAACTGIWAGADTACSGPQFSETGTFAIPDYVVTGDVAGVVARNAVVGGSGTVTSVEVSFGLTHTFSGDIRITLTSPNAITQTIFERVGGTAASPTCLALNGDTGNANDFGGTYTISDAAATGINTAMLTGPSPLASGSYQAQACTGSTLGLVSLNTVFAGAPVAGTWTLTVYDLDNVSTGTLTSFALTLNGGLTPCVGVGACCTGSACSVVLDAGSCAGTFQGINSTCSPNPCSAPTTDNCCRGTTCNPVTAGSCTGSVAGSASIVVASCGAGNTLTSCCYADYNHDGIQSIDDLFLYFNAYFTGSPYANMGGNTIDSPTIDDLFLYINAYFGTCS